MKKFNEFDKVNESDIYDDKRGYQLNDEGEIAEEYAKKIIIDSMAQFRSPINTWLDTETHMKEIFGEEDYREPLSMVKFELIELLDNLRKEVNNMNIPEKDNSKKRRRLSRD